VILIDARKGVLTQTRRHSYLVAARHPHVVVAVNKMDLVGLRPRHLRSASTRVPRVRRPARPRTTGHGDPAVGAEGRQHGDAPAPHTPWYHGPTLMPTLETVESTRAPAARGRCGCRCSGSIAPQPGLPRLLPADRRRRAAPGERRSACSPRAREPRGPHRHQRRRPRRGRGGSRSR
jgi:hypothetical protein